jgi:AdoMet dependent proline di-methyltransferase
MQVLTKVKRSRSGSPAEQCRKFPAQHRAVNFFQMGLQDFTPEPQRCVVLLRCFASQRRLYPACHLSIIMPTSRFVQCRYDVFWVQWCLMYLTDGMPLAPPNFVQMACCADASRDDPMANTASMASQAGTGSAEIAHVLRVADDVLAWLARCSSALKPGGIIAVKENLTTVARFEMCGVMRSRSHDACALHFRSTLPWTSYGLVCIECGLLRTRALLVSQ